jgi:hypothetical protein
MDPESDVDYESKNKLQEVINEMLVYYQNNNKPGTKDFSEDIKLLLYNKTKVLANDISQTGLISNVDVL